MSTLLHLSQYQNPVNEYQKAVYKSAKFQYYRELKISEQGIDVKLGVIKLKMPYTCNVDIFMKLL